MCSVGCTSSPSPAPAPVSDSVDVDRVVYRFNDASVPPPSHRSFTITVVEGSVEKVVDSYGDEISRETLELDAAHFDLLVTTFRAAKAEAGTGASELPACTGGTSESVEVYAGTAQVFAGTISHCGGGHAPDFSGDLGEFIGAVKSAAEG
jgi:hypothetical protein